MSGFTLGAVGPKQFGAAASAQGETMSTVATGKSVKNAADNPATFAIAQQMMSQKIGYDATGDALALGEATVSIGRAAAEAISGLLGEIKQKTILAGAVGADTGALQNEIDGLVEQIDSVAGAAGFGGLNTVNGSGPFSTLSAVYSDGSGQVQTTSITVDKTDLTTGGAVSALALIDVATKAGRLASLSTLETLSSMAIETAAELGRAENQMTSRQTDLQRASDGYEQAIAATVGADMPAASAELAAQDVQMQIAIRAADVEDARNTSLLRLFKI